MAGIYRFGPYKLNADACTLERGEQVVALRPKLVETLAVLVEKAPDVVSKEELMRRVWPDVTVVESSLTRNISELRSELESGCPGESAIETLPKRGYRFALPVSREAESPPAATAPHFARRVAPVAAAALAGVALLVGARSFTDPEAEESGATAKARPSIAEAAFRSGFALYDTWRPEDVEAATFHFERSIRAAPELWYGHVGSTVAQTAGILLAPEATPEANARLLATADKAVLYGPEAAATHAVRSTALLLVSWDWEGAAREVEAAVRWNPRGESGYERRGLWNTLQGRFDAAREDYDKALELRTDFDDCQLLRAFNEYCARRYDDAVAGVLQALPSTKKQQAAHRLLALAYGAQGDWTRSAEAAEKSGLSDFDHSRLEAWQLGSQGARNEAEAARDRLRAICREEDRSYCDTAVADVALGDFDAAFASLEQGLRQRHWALLIHSIDPRLEVLHEDRRWDRLMAAVHPSSATH